MRLKKDEGREKEIENGKGRDGVGKETKIREKSNGKKGGLEENKANAEIKGERTMLKKNGTKKKKRN